MTEPGWYTDPRDSSQYRYWDGTSWTEAVAPGSAAESYTAATAESAEDTATAVEDTASAAEETVSAVEETVSAAEDTASAAEEAVSTAASAINDTAGEVVNSLEDEVIAGDARAVAEPADTGDVVDRVSEQLGAVLGGTSDTTGDLIHGGSEDVTAGLPMDGPAAGLSVDEALHDLDPAQRVGEALPSADAVGQGISVDDVLSEVETPFDDATETMVVDVPDFSEAPDLGDVGIPGDGVSFSSPIDYGTAGETAVISNADLPSADAGSPFPSTPGDPFPPPPSPTPVGFDPGNETTGPAPAVGGGVGGSTPAPEYASASAPAPEFGTPGGTGGFDVPPSDPFGQPPQGPTGFDQGHVPYPDHPGPRPLTPPPAAPAKSRTPWIVLGVLGLAVVAVLAFLAIRSPGRTSVDAITEGQCFANFDQFEATEIRSSVSSADCEGEHALEVFEVTDDPYRDFEEYPGEQVITDLAFRHCLDGFEGFVGTTYEASELDVWALYPTEGSWNLNDDREVVCMVGAYNQTLTTGTLQNSGR